LSRLFISHSSKDSITAKAFKQWLGTNGWPDEDVFLDLDDIGAGERWKEALRKANARCEAVILLASRKALSSPECLAEIRKAEDYGKEIVVVLLRDVKFEDRRLDSFKDRQIVNLESKPQTHVETVTYHEKTHKVRFNSDALASVKDYLIKRGITSDHFAWPPNDKQDAEPYPGLSAFGEEDAGIFFGRDTDILRGLDKLRVMRRVGSPNILVIQAASGAGKSSYLRAGLWPRLGRDTDFSTVAIIRPARGILTGPDGLGRKLAAQLSRPDAPINPGDVHNRLMAQDAAQAGAEFTSLMSDLAERTHQQRRLGDAQARAPALVVAVDQAEELFAPEDEAESKRFLALLALFMQAPPAGLFVLLTIRAEGAVRLFRMITDHKLEFPETLPLLPLPRTSYRDVILKPLEVIKRRGQTLTIAPELAERLVTEATGADALPLLAFTLLQLYQGFSAKGTITVEQYDAMGSIAGSIALALKRALDKPGNAPVIPTTKPEQLADIRAAFIPWLARINPDNGLAMRRVARQDEFAENQLAMVKRLVEARLLVADHRSDGDVVEIAHESLLRQWPDLTEWLKDESENLKLVDAVERAAADWQRNNRHDDWLDHRGSRLRAAAALAEREDFAKRLGQTGLTYLEACRDLQSRRRWTMAKVAACLVLVVIAGAVAWQQKQQAIKDGYYWLTHVSGHVLTAAAERALQPGKTFQECTECPTMVVVPAGDFLMGSPEHQGALSGREYPQRKVTMTAPFAVAQVELTFAEWDACGRRNACDREISDAWGRGPLPVINVTWDDAQRYVGWLAKITGQPYRLLSEAEYEYAARAGNQKAYPWSTDSNDGIGSGNANCGECGSPPWQATQTAPVKLFPANRFGLYDMVGNVFEWVADCGHDNYRGAPSDASPWMTANCRNHVVRGGAWQSRPELLRSASRDWYPTGARKDYIGFRVARTLNP
jgi:formylglycine-generating enzyme required for sulfatase activity